MKRGLKEDFEELLERLSCPKPTWANSLEEVNFKSKGEVIVGKDPIILLHGLFGAVSNWDSVYPLMKRYASPIAVHFPLISARRQDVRIKPLVAYSWLFLRRNNINRAVICGNSLGGHVALRLCLAAPEMVKCLILSGSSGLYEHSVDTVPLRPDETFVRYHMSRVFYDKSYVTDEHVREVLTVLQNRKQMMNIVSAARSAKKDYLLEELKKIDCPTLLIWGENDEITTLEVAKIFKDNLKNSKLVTIKECGHAPMIEQPERFNAAVYEFLQEI